MSKYNIFKIFRELFREYKLFGSQELDAVRRQLVEQKQELEKLRVSRQERLQMEEALALGQLRKTLQSIERMDGSLKDGEKGIKERVDNLEKQAVVAAQLAKQQRATEMLQGIDVMKFLSGELDEASVQAALLSKAGDKQVAKAATKQRRGKKPTEGSSPSPVKQ